MTTTTLERATANRFLRAIPRAALDDLLPHLETVEMEARDLIHAADSEIKNICFVEHGLISLMKTMEDGRVVEIGAIGPEGLSGVPALFGISNPNFDSMVQVPGVALCAPAVAVREIVARDEETRATFLRYAQFATDQLAQTAACNRLHSLEERCCRWLLIAADAARAESVPITHEFLAMLMGVRRAGVSFIASKMQKAGRIRTTRGRVTITNRAALEGCACECYRAMLLHYRRLLPSAPAA